MIVQFYTVKLSNGHRRKITVKNVESINEAKFKLKVAGVDDQIIRTDTHIEEIKEVENADTSES